MQLFFGKKHLNDECIGVTYHQEQLNQITIPLNL